MHATPPQTPHFTNLPIRTTQISSNHTMFSVARALRLQTSTLSRHLTTVVNSEESLTKLIFEGLDDGNANVEVKDISGGCGSMYDVQVESSVFKGMSKVKQSRMVQDLIKKEIGEMHGLTLKTKAI
ncbi:hypothetical protein TrLO_g6444 [Triparma laevis f. longispina]|uniref:Bola-like protein n=1 Tax=Triparma laevis f. longispina TaxID=1714387 RepID=A0A9W7DYR6_9STRA|nr:hypothetical protein TrLO_g6444 [Triparma laevis f. longispina]